MNRFLYSRCNAPTIIYLKMVSHVFILCLLFSISCVPVSKVKIKTMKYSYYNDTIKSLYLNEDRIVSIFKPSNFDKNKKYPIIYALDGQLITLDSYISKIDSLINTKQIPEIILIAIYSNETKVSGSIYEYRNYEYCESLSTETKDTILNQLYANHLKFLLNEVEFYIKKEGIQSSEKIFFGTSNGGGLGLSIAASYQKAYDIYLLMSPGCGKINELNWDKSKELPFLYISYGNEEPLPFQIEAKNYIELIKERGYNNYKINVFDGGHNRKSWSKNFIIEIVKILNDDINTNR